MKNFDLRKKKPTAYETHEIIHLYKLFFSHSFWLILLHLSYTTGREMRAKIPQRARICSKRRAKWRKQLKYFHVYNAIKLLICIVWIYIPHKYWITCWGWIAFSCLYKYTRIHTHAYCKCIQYIRHRQRIQSAKSTVSIAALQSRWIVSASVLEIERFVAEI